MLQALVNDIKSEFQDEDGSDLVPLLVLKRLAERMLPLVANDLGAVYALAGDLVVPEMPADHREAWALRTKIQCCRFLRAQSAGRLSFSSGDKSMDRSREASNWASLEKDITGEYKALVGSINPLGDDSILTLDVRPMRYSRGRFHDRQHPNHDCMEE